MKSPYTIAERAKLVRRVQQKVRLRGKTVSAACKEVGIFDSQFYRWQKSTHGTSDAEFKGSVTRASLPTVQQAIDEVTASEATHQAAVDAGQINFAHAHAQASSLQAENDKLWGVIRALARAGQVKIVVT